MDSQSADIPKTQGEIEDAVCKSLNRFEQEHMGRGPTNTRAYLLDDLLVVRMSDVLTTAEKKLVQAPASEKAKDLVKEVRARVMESAEITLESMIEEATGVKVVSMHRDISTVTGEKIVIFTLAQSPLVRSAKIKS